MIKNSSRELKRTRSRTRTSDSYSRNSVSGFNRWDMGDDRSGLADRRECACLGGEPGNENKDPGEPGSCWGTPRDDPRGGVRLWPGGTFADLLRSSSEA